MSKHTPRPAIYQPETDTYLIPLTRGYFATVDAADVDLAGVNWCARLSTSGRVYAVRGCKGRREHLHRVIAARSLGRDLLPAEEIDHIKDGGLLNTRANLRLATHKQNMSNQSRRKNNMSGYKGVHWDAHARKWQAQIKVNGKSKYLGYRDTAEAAHALYCEAAEELHGEFFNPG